jgi:hypothetical protein
MEAADKSEGKAAGGRPALNVDIVAMAFEPAQRRALAVLLIELQAWLSNIPLYAMARTQG